VAWLVFVSVLWLVQFHYRTETEVSRKDTIAVTPAAHPPPSFEVDQILRLYTEQGHDFLAADHLPEEGLAILTREAQTWMWRNQHRSPSECAKATYWAFPDWKGGIGSQVHVAGLLAGLAATRGHIWFWAKDSGRSYARSSHCGDVTNWECYFRAPTNCSPESYATESNTIRTAPGDWPSLTFVPPAMQQRVAEVAPHMCVNETKYWWRAQSAAYVMRLNARTVEAVARRRKGEGMVRIESAVRGAAAVAADRLRTEVASKQPGTTPASLFPLPRGTVSIHVRHGDKYTEMTLQPFARYVEGAKDLFRWQPLSLSRTMFVSTEDAQVIREAATNADGWVALYSDIPRHNSNGFEQLGLADDITLLHLTQLLMALECDAWVGTLASNWNRLIDELRCVWVAKCSHPYKEVGDTWHDYHW
jgi:hypothetical protein